MSMVKDAGHTAARINISRILEMFLRGDITPGDAVADLKKFCHPQLSNDDGAGLDAYIAKTLAMVQTREFDVDSALSHLVELSAAKTLDVTQTPVFKAV
ncbi:hypothetical protein [Asticcacaulis sp. AC466]|uniref:hypothetical protein n=1 Tax=Asticcacaulis sp. AC466 TaxID=1282362 RepID=UPI0012DCE903|nr:hypothetical protein [Asticcacaulis sp. AC466]